MTDQQQLGPSALDYDIALFFCGCEPDYRENPASISKIASTVQYLCTADVHK